MDESIPELMYTTFSMLFLLLGVVLIATIVMSTINPYDQIAFANVEKIRSSMNQACLGQTVTVEKFSLPQNTPALNGVLGILPAWLINSNGDPNYVMYYESYPPGEAIGWEVYQDMQSRVIVYLPEGWDGRNQEDVADYIEEVMNKARDKQLSVEGVVVGNIVISKTRSDFFVGENPNYNPEEDTGFSSSNRKYGEWSQLTADTGVPVAGDNYFKFNSYVTLNSFEKSVIKYQACGENSLCLKTRSGVYRFPLTQCDDIKGIQVVYDARDRGKVYGSAGIVVGVTIACVYTGGILCAAIGRVASAAGWIGRTFLRLGWATSKTVTVAGTAYAGTEVLQWLGGALLSYKTQDFNLASPCEIKEMKIEKAKCVDTIPLDWAPDQKACTDGHVAKYPIYEYGSDSSLHKTGDHYTCAEKVNDQIDDIPLESYGNGDQCLQMTVVEKTSGFCWTADPYKDTLISDTQVIAQTLGFIPVYNSLGYLKVSNEGYSFVLQTTNTSSLARNIFDSPIRWQWPG